MDVDLVITNAKGLTMDPARPRAQAVAAKAGRIVALGSTAEIAALAGPGTRVIDAGGRSLLPGFVESHMHLLLGGSELMQLHIHGLRGQEKLAAAVAKYRAGHPDLPLIMAQGAEWGLLGRPMTRQELDKICPDLPIALWAPDHHTVWANTIALEKAGILHGAETQPGHIIVMAEDGTATGELREFGAYERVIALGGAGRLHLSIATGEEPVPEPTPEERAADMAVFAAGLAHCAAHGITTIVNMDGNRYQLSLLDEMRRTGQLTARVKIPFHFKPHMDIQALDRAEAMHRDYNDDWLSSGFVKMFIDGVLDSHTALMVDDYPNSPGDRGMPLFELDRYSAICTEIDRRRLQIAVHSIGDGAVRATLDGYEAALKANGPWDSRHRVEHVEIINRADIPRFAALGVTASVQPSHPPGVMDFPAEPTLTDHIGKDRWRDAYVWKTLVDAGARIAFASDWPVTDVNVMRSLQAALTRVPYDGAADERLGFMDTLFAYTAGGAWAAHMEGLVGTLAPGMAADFVLIDGDIETIPADQLGKTGIALTIAGGQITHQGAGFAA
ncbi:MAG: amidohydrolase [Rhodobacteraceae bacterium]|nr:amidohydrolase [Paracoccaceae bacterium]